MPPPAGNTSVGDLEARGTMGIGLRPRPRAPRPYQGPALLRLLQPPYPSRLPRALPTSGLACLGPCLPLAPPTSGPAYLWPRPLTTLSPQTPPTRSPPASGPGPPEAPPHRGSVRLRLHPPRATWPLAQRPRWGGGAEGRCPWFGRVVLSPRVVPEVQRDPGHKTVLVTAPPLPQAPQQAAGHGCPAAP